MPAGITIREVAARAGVSHQTVSRVINGNERVSPETRRKVEAAIAELGYQPNAMARDMALGRPHTFACLSPNLTDYTFASIIEGATVQAHQKGFYVMSASAPDDDTFTMLIEQLVSSRRTEGLIVINPYADGRHTHVPQNVPTVLVGARPRAGGINSVALDDEGAGRIATRHLIDLGHRRIAMLTGPLVEDCSQDRQDGYEACLRAAGLEPDPALISEGDWTATSGFNAVRRWLELGVPFTALFAQNDRMAIGAIRALHEAGLRVPDDISVVGFDDMPLASYFYPSLTTVRQDMLAIGAEAARLLIDAVENPGAACQHLRMTVELVVRESTSTCKS
ncbi:MAG: LacI family DNA-binding transcriptional regulator [Anaerolineales bacterium]|nr:LacI family DNA-binding transcriptional regulator [Anaerolineales bacterium]